MLDAKLFKIVKEIPDLLNSSLELDECLRSIVNTTKSIFPDGAVALYYLSECYASLKYSDDVNNFVDFEISSSTLNKLENDGLVRFSDSSLLNNLEQRELYLFPLKIRQAIFGFICVAVEYPLSEDVIDVVKTLASVASYSIKDSELSNVFKIQLKALLSGIIDKTKDMEIIKEQNKKILEADKVKNDFIANISHELRTPLNAIIGFSEVLGSKIFGELNEKQAEYINDIYTSGVHLLGMINEILDISKIESNAMKLNYTEFDFRSSVNEVLNVMKPLSDKKNIDVTFDANFDKTVKLDYQKLQQIFYNLLSNAIKFTAQNGKIWINAELKDTGVSFSVNDNGMGIPSDAQSKIFDKFVQLENTYTKTGSSTGLGLTITKKFVEMMNGTIKLKSEIGVGTSFEIFLPLEKNNG